MYGHNAFQKSQLPVHENPKLVRILNSWLPFLMFQCQNIFLTCWNKKKVVTAIFFFLIFSAFLNHEEPIYCHTFWSQFCCHMVWFFRAICKLVLRLFLRHGGLPHLSLTWCEFLKPSLILGGSVNVCSWQPFSDSNLSYFFFFLLENYIQSHLVFLDAIRCVNNIKSHII